MPPCDTFATPALSSFASVSGVAGVLSQVLFGGTSYVFEYRQTIQYATEQPCDINAYNAWRNQNFGANLNNPPYPPTLVAILSDDWLFQIRLYPLGLTEFSPPTSIATNIFGTTSDFCGLADFYFQQIKTLRWSHGLTSTHYYAMQLEGNLQFTSTHQNPNLPPVWADGPNKGSDGVDRTQYVPWTYGSIVAGGRRELLIGGSVGAQYQTQLGGPTIGGGFFTLDG